MFHFKQFDLAHERSTLKIGTDAVLLAALTNPKTAQSVLDIGCGCGVIAFCLAQKLAENQTIPNIVGIDVDADSIAEARENAEQFPLLPTSCFHFENIRLQDFVNQENRQSFDLIVSNPPFFHGDLKPQDKSKLQSKHGDGQLSFQELVDGVDALLSKNGRFALILPPTEMAEFHQLTIGKWHCRKSVHIRPTDSKPVYRIVREYGRTYFPTTEHYLSIRDTSLQYKQEYIELVKPYLTIFSS
jgi:tRNA1Val (adenine37-N6)-methyltransferase